MRRVVMYDKELKCSSQVDSICSFLSEMVSRSRLIFFNGIAMEDNVKVWTVKTTMEKFLRDRIPSQEFHIELSLDLSEHQAHLI